MLRTFFELEGNQIVLNFVHGLIFFLLGFGVLLKAKRWSDLTLAKSLPWLGLFGILNGLGDWGLVFIPIQTYVFSERVIDVLWLIDTTILALSYACLLFGGLHLLAQTRPALYWLPKLVPFGFVLWFVGYLSFWLDMGQSMQPRGDVMKLFEVGYRYGFAFLGSLAMAWALSLQRAELEKLDLKSSIPPLQWVGYSFVIHAVAAGLIVSEAPLFPATVLNERVFFELTAIPVRLFTGISGAIVAISMLLSMEVFDEEFARRLDEARKMRTVMQERTRIARDLHDGIIQTLYAVGLGLEGVVLSLDPPDDSRWMPADSTEDDPREHVMPTEARDVVKPTSSPDTEVVREEITGIMQSLDRAIRDVRGYIMQLKMPTQELSLDEHLHIFAREIQRETRVPVRIKTTPMDSGLIPPEAVMDLLLIVREAVSNASRHAKASEINVTLIKDEEGISLSIYDDGIGFDPEAVPAGTAGEHMGLDNMRRRADSIGGRLSIHGDIGHGTEILLRIPLYSQG